MSGKKNAVKMLKSSVSVVSLKHAHFIRMRNQETGRASTTLHCGLIETDSYVDFGKEIVLVCFLMKCLGI
jgi:hypothetical protein